LAADRADYFRCIDEALAEGWSADRVRRAYRWLAVEYTMAVIDIEDGFKQAEGGRRPLLPRVRDRLLRVFDPLHSQRSDTRALALPLRHAEQLANVILGDEPVVALQERQLTPLSAASEDMLLRSEVRRIVEQVYPDESYRDTPLIRNLRAFATGSAGAVAQRRLA
jgi:hypothetical protein